MSVNAQRLQKSAQRGDVLLRHTWKSKCISCPQMDQLICPQMDLLKTFFSVWQHVTLPYISCLWASQNVTNGQSRAPVYIYMLRRVEITWFGFILSVSFCRTLFTKSKTLKKKPAILCLWASRNLPNGQLRCPLHIYMMRRIQWTWFGVILSSNFWCMPFTKSKMQKKNSYFVLAGKLKFAQWAITVSVAHLHDDTNTMNLIWRDSER